MGFRFRKSIRLGKGVRLNVSKSGASFSLGGKGLTFNAGSRGLRTTVGIPGTGLSYSATAGFGGGVKKVRPRYRNTPDSLETHPFESFAGSELRGALRGPMLSRQEIAQLRQLAYSVALPTWGDNPTMREFLAINLPAFVTDTLDCEGMEGPEYSALSIASDAWHAARGEPNSLERSVARMHGVEAAASIFNRDPRSFDHFYGTKPRISPAQVLLLVVALFLLGFFGLAAFIVWLL